MYKNIIILVLILVILMMSKSFLKPNPAPIVITTTDTTTEYKDTTIYRPGKSIVKDTTIYDTIPFLVPADTMAILKDYFAKNVYEDTILFAEGNVVLKDTISQNKILGRTFKSNIAQKTIKVTRELRTPPSPPKPQLYWGIMATKQEDKFGYGGGVIYKSPYKGIIQLNITNNKQIQLGYYSKIF